MLEKQNKYSIRKLSVGAASVLIGVSIFGVNSQLVKADTVDSNNPQISKNIESVQNKPTNDTTDTLNQKETAEKPETNVKQPDSSTLSNGVDNSTIQSQGSNNPLNQTTEEQKAPQNNDTKPVSDNVKPNLNTAGQVQPVTPHKGSTETSLTIDPKRATNTRANVVSLMELKTVANTNTNGRFDSSWGQLDVNQWKGSVVGDYYQLTSYTGDANHIIVPNDADFAKAGVDISGKQVGVTSDFMHTIFRDKTTAQDATVAFSKTDNKMVKAIGGNWYNTWGHDLDFINGRYLQSGAKLAKFDGSNLDVSNVTNMSRMFESNQISDLTPLSNWKTDNVTNMRDMFESNQIRDLSPLSNWKTDKVTDMSDMFESNQIRDLSPLSNWKTDKVTDMSGMFESNQIRDLSPLSNWKTDNVTDMSDMFYNNQISDLTPLSNWKTDKVTDTGYMFYNNQINNLTPLSNWKTDNYTLNLYTLIISHVT